MEGLVPYQEALARGMIRKGKYFKTIYYDGREILWRLEKPWGNYVMWGPPTVKELFLRDKESYDDLFEWVDKYVRDEFEFPEIFSKVQACGTRTTFRIRSQAELKQAEEKLSKIYCKNPDDKDLVPYVLASRCIRTDDYYKYYSVFYVNNGGVDSCVDSYLLYGTNGLVISIIYAIRPEAMPNPDCYIQMDGRDGSREKPYVLLGGETPDRGKPATIYKEEPASSGKDELQQLIHEAKGFMTEERQKNWLSKLEACAKRL